MPASLLSVNVGAPALLVSDDRVETTSIRKAPVRRPVLARRLGIEGDRVSDTANHGGTDMAVYAFAREDLDRWGAKLGAELPSGQFGENLTTVGIDVNAALVGERWRVGRALFEVAKVRIPCATFQRWMAASGHEPTGWVKRFTEEGRPGPYLRVLEEGLVEAGDEIVVEHVPEHGITVSDMFRILTTEKHRLPELQAVDGLAASVREKVDALLRR